MNNKTYHRDIEALIEATRTHNLFSPDNHGRAIQRRSTTVSFVAMEMIRSYCMKRDARCMYYIADDGVHIYPVNQHISPVITKHEGTARAR